MHDRYDYDSQRELRTFRMASTTHDLLASQFASEFMHHLKFIADEAENQEIADMCHGFRAFSTAQVNLLEHGTCSPDESFRYKDTRFPGVVVEVAHAQKIHDLPRLAMRYINGSKGNIRMMVALNTDYRTSKLAQVMVWQMEIHTTNDKESSCTVKRTVKSK